MWRLALAQMRRTPGRLAAAGVAIALGSAFVAVALLAGDVMTQTAYRAVTAQYANADVVVEGEGITDTDAAAIGEAPGVRLAEPRASVWAEVSTADGTLWLQIDAPATEPRLEPRRLVDGHPPRDGEIALPAASAESLGLELGDQVALAFTHLSDDGMELSTSVHRLRLVGLVDDTASGLTGQAAGLAPRADVLEWLGYDALGHELIYQRLLVAGDGTVSDAELRTAVRDALDSTNRDSGLITVRTLDEQAEWIIADVTREARLVTTIGLGFAAIALLVAALVIANTFQVLVAQRVRTLALLRCVGADRYQLRRGVIFEALVLGVLGAAAGIALGVLLVQGALLVLAQTWPEVPLPNGARVTASSVLLPLVVGVAVTVVAALAPARAATRVSPLAAMRPADVPRFTERSGKARAWFAGALVASGAAAMGLGIVVTSSDVGTALGLGVLGGGLSFIGILLSAVFWTPRLVALASRLGSRSAAVRLAAANSGRNPRRTAATSAALLIGVTLVVMMSTGAAAARYALAERLDEEFPFDVEARAFYDNGLPGELPPTLVQEMEQVGGVSEVAVLTVGAVEIQTPGTALYADAVGMSTSDAERVLRADEQFAGLGDDAVVVPVQVAEWSGVVDGDVVTLAPVQTFEVGPDGELLKPQRAEGQEIVLHVVVSDLPGTSVLLTPETLQVVDAQSAAGLVWVRLDDAADAREAAARIEAAASRTTGPAVAVAGPATERAAFQEVIDTMLAIVVGLLAVSVVIALVGVANTLSLSVIERRRESATLRAIGLSRRQLRASLAAEGMVIAGVGALAGAVIGTVYGWVGARTVLDGVGPTPFAVVWRDVAAVVVVAMLAGLVASVLPARSAVRTSPVEALAVE